MMVLWIVLAILFLTLFWILMVPVTIRIDTEEQIYLIRMPLIFRASIKMDEDRIIVTTKIFELISYNFKPRLPFQKRKRHKKKKRSRRKIPFRGILHAVRDAFRAIKIKRLEVEFDTDDVILNAKIYPLCMRLSNERYQLMVNFENYYRFFLLIQFRIISFLRIGFLFAWKQYLKPVFNFK